jgi:hypothetical protein
MTTRFPHTIVIAGVLVLAVVYSSVSARPLAGRTRLEFGGGVRHHQAMSEIAVSFDDDNAWGAAHGGFAKIGVSNWISEDIAFAIDYTIHDVETDTWWGDYGDRWEELQLVHSVMFGFRFYWPQSRPYSTMRPYFSAGAGPFMGTIEYHEEDACDCEMYKEIDHTAVLGARLGGGIDFLMGRDFMVGLTGGYVFADEFTNPVGGRYDYSGSEFGMSFSILFGRRHR